MLPQRLFVTTGIFDQFVNNDDELAMILGHEISHLIQGHLSESSMFESFLRGIEIVILMIDPTDGLLSLGECFDRVSVTLFALCLCCSSKYEGYFSSRCRDLFGKYTGCTSCCQIKVP
jgi:Zn-dependent protease with chaperone function